MTVFSVVREMILDDLSAWRPDHLARVASMDVSYTLYRQLRTAGAFEDLAFYRGFGDVGNTDPHDRLYGLFGRLRGSASLEQTRQAFAAGAERLRGPVRRGEKSHYA